MIGKTLGLQSPQMTQTNGHHVHFKDDAEQRWREACWRYLFLALRNAKTDQLVFAADAIWEARKAYVR